MAKNDAYLPEVRKLQLLSDHIYYFAMLFCRGNNFNTQDLDPDLAALFDSDPRESAAIPDTEFS